MKLQTLVLTFQHSSGDKMWVWDRGHPYWRLFFPAHAVSQAWGGVEEDLSTGTVGLCSIQLINQVFARHASRDWLLATDKL